MSQLLIAIGAILAITTGLFVNGGARAADTPEKQVIPYTVTRDENGWVNVNGKSYPPGIDGNTVISTPDGDFVVGDNRGMTREQIIASHKMSLEAEAKIVHEVPLCPVIIDGVEYKPEQIHLFDGQSLTFTAGKDGLEYAFTREADLWRFIDEQANSNSSSGMSVLTTDYFSVFYYDALLQGVKLECRYDCPLRVMPSGWNNVISSMEVTTESYCCLWDDPDYEGDSRVFAPGAVEQWLTYYGWNDRASSILHVE